MSVRIRLKVIATSCFVALMSVALSGCGGGGGGAGQFSQEFEKPAAAPNPAGDIEPPVGAVNPRERRNED